MLANEQPARVAQRRSSRLKTLPPEGMLPAVAWTIAILRRTMWAMITVAT
jgi:hypothetical protein